MIEKKIKYDINIEKPSKTKPVKQGGVFNYLGKQKTVNAPVKWRSSKDHPIAHLSYITKDEQKILIDLNLYGSLKGKPNRGPFGLPSLQGSGGGSGGDGDGSSGGDSGGPGDSGPGGSDDGSGHGGPGGPGDSGPGGSDDGTGHGGPGVGGPGGESTGDAPGTQGGTVGEAEAAAQAASENPAEQTAVEAAVTAVQQAIENQVQQAINNPVQTAISIANPALGFTIGLAQQAVSNISRGVTAPNDFSQAQTSVQSGPQGPSGEGGIVDLYATLNNSSTGNPTMDAYIRRLRINLGLPV